jgi:hypothetical protein
MILLLAKRTRRAAPLAVTALVVCAFAAVRLPALAAPAVPAEKTSLSASLESSSVAVPLSGSFGYTSHVRLSEPASYLQTRFQVRQPTGKLVYQRTMVENSAPAGTVSYSFGRALDGLGLKPGAYPVHLSVTAEVAGSTQETEVASDLLIYDVKSAALPVVVVARIHGSPLSDPQGRFAVDPASPEAEIPRADVDRIAALVIDDPGARIVLGVPPVLLAEWKRLSAGYLLSDGTAVPADNPIARSYADTLTRLRAAVDTGRLELVSLGYSDPDLSTLVQEGLVDDIGPQYEVGISACFAGLETTPSAGTVPAGDCAPPQSLRRLTEQGISYVVIREACVSWGKIKSASGAYPVAKESVTALVSDDKSSQAASRGDTDVVLRRAFARLVAGSKPQQPFTLLIDLGPGRPDATSTVVAAASRLGAEPWARLALGREIRPPAKTRTVTFAQAPGQSQAPVGYWKTVRAARAYADAILAALGSGGPGVGLSQTDSLLAQSAAWAEPGGTWAGAERGLVFANASLGVSKAALGDVSIKAVPITFAGKRGEVPVTITNTTKNTLKVVVRAAASGDAQVVGGRVIQTVLPPQETFVPIPVDMKSALTSKLKVEVLAGNVVLAHTTVDVQASYLDRIAIIMGIVLVLGLFLAFIVRRVRSAETDSEAAERDSVSAGSSDERYTRDEPDAHLGADDT